MEENDNPIKVTLTNLADLAHFLDTNIKAWNVSRYNRDSKKNLESTEYPNNLAEYVKIEQLALGFWFEGCTAKREWSVLTDAGEEIGPMLPNQLEPSALEYLTQRFDHSSNPYLKARYGLILWNSPKPFKHIRYIQASFDNLLTALKYVDSVDRPKSEDDAIDILRQLCAVTTTIGYREADAIATPEELYKYKGINKRG